VQQSARRFYLLLGLITAIGLGVRLGYAIGVKWDQTIWGDAFKYHHAANGLVDGYGFQTWIPKKLLGHSSQIVLNTPAHGGRDAFPIGESADSPPLYTTYLAAWSLFGLRSFHWHMIASVMLGTASVFVMGLVGRKIAGPRAGLIAAAIAAVYANFWVNDPVVTTESMGILAGAALMLVAYRAWEQPTWQRAVWVGTVGGIAALVRAEFVLLLPLVLVPFVVRRLAGRSIKERVGVLAASGAVALLVMSPWLIRNLTMWEHPETLSTTGGLALAVGSCDTTYNGPMLGWWSPICVQHHLPKADPSAEDAYWRTRAFDYMGSHLGRFPVVALARFGRMWELYHPGSPWGDPTGNQKITFDIIEGRSENAARIALGQYYLLMPFAIVGAVILWRRKVTIVPLVALPIVASIVAVYTFGNTRYRTIAEVAIVAFAAVAVDALVRRYRPGWLRLEDEDTGLGPHRAEGTQT
jgi:hypothetical protein